jgi:hypothetical protein
MRSSQKIAVCLSSVSLRTGTSTAEYGGRTTSGHTVNRSAGRDCLGQPDDALALRPATFVRRQNSRSDTAICAVEWAAKYGLVRQSLVFQFMDGGVECVPFFAQLS